MPGFLQPTTLEEAFALLDGKGETRFLAGGTDLLVLLRLGAISCDNVMDVKRIPELSTLRLTDETLEIGAAWTCNQILAAPEVGSEYAPLRQASAALANSLLRNRATLVGNICNASPGGDMLPACLVLEGSVVAASSRGERTIALKDFFTGVKKNVLKPDEIVLRTVFPRTQGRGTYLKKKRIHGHDLAQVSVAGFYADDGHLRLALGAVAITPLLLDFGVIPAAELPARRTEIIEAVAAAAKPITDVRASREYRLAMGRLFTERIIDGLIDGSLGLAEDRPCTTPAREAVTA
ncbi:MAG: FAD binding domain-containing protein [Coriobacteriales bacterium]|jgi:carbon-monoxide dehydrogenase medium subunit|nr:FAD binding domain-containing protein [Coriobacteriales bacterium]